MTCVVNNAAGMKSQNRLRLRKSEDESIEWKIRPATSDDREAVEQLLDTSYSKLFPADHGYYVTLKALPVMAKAQPELLSCGTWYLVHHPTTGELVGCGGWSFRIHQDPLKISRGRKVPHLRHYATHPNWLRQGVARAIWRQVVRDLIGTEEEDLLPTMEVFSSLTGVPFFSALGFAPVKRLDLPVMDDCLFPCIHMRRQSEIGDMVTDL